MRLTPIFLFLLLLATSCTTCTNNDVSTNTEDMYDEGEDADNISMVFYDRGIPSKYVGNIPYYDSFNDIEYLLHEETDTTYLVNFWATWCKPCVEEMPYIEEVNKAYKDEKVKVVLVSLDFKKMIERKLIPYIEENNIESEVIYLADANTREWGNRISTFWDGSIPFTVLYNNYDRKEFAQVHSFAEVDNIVRPMVEEVKNKELQAMADEDIMANKGEDVDFIPMEEEGEADVIRPIEPEPIETIETEGMDEQK